MLAELVPIASKARRSPSEIHDRLIVATARVLDVALITADHEIRASGQVDTIS